MSDDFRIHIELMDTNTGLSSPFVSFIPQQRSFVGSLLSDGINGSNLIMFVFNIWSHLLRHN